jgi:hypothetical protein
MDCMAAWFNFLGIVGGQLVILLALAYVWNVGMRMTYTVLWRSMLLGLPLGFLYDLLIGRTQLVFFYSGVPAGWLFLALNGALSYGFAIATARLMPITLPRLHKRDIRMTGVLLCMIAIALLFLPALFARHPLAVMFVTGTIVILCSEGVALLSGYSGPLYSLLQRNARPVMQLWLASVGIGALYEILNALFPLWHWQTGGSLPHWGVELLIVLFGYFVLFLPMLVLSRLLIFRQRT